jgi:oxygen-independent coproporphyrinogen III oxidase
VVHPRHLYVHVPFCARRCSYCDFSIAVRKQTPVDEYVSALRTELQLVGSDRLPATGTRTSDGLPTEGTGSSKPVHLASDRLDTLYLGGGTPSRLGGPGIARVLDAVREHAPLGADAEVTIEANPDDVSDIAVRQWAAAGVNRISLGAQSFDDSVLEWMHRTHDSHQIADAVQTIRRTGIENISLDLIFALPSHLNRDWSRDIDCALALRPSHISLYGLTVESHTPIARWADRGMVVEGSEAQYEEEFLEAHEAMSAAGFEHYEVSNFALPGGRSRHNSAYWSGAPYLGVGPSAHSFDGSVRRWNVAAYSEWLRRMSAGLTPTAGEETLTPENREAERVYLGLRTSAGLKIENSELARLDPWRKAGWAVTENDRIRLTAAGWLRLDSLAAKIVARPGSAPNLTLGATPSGCYI